MAMVERKMRREELIGITGIAVCKEMQKWEVFQAIQKFDSHWEWISMCIKYTFYDYVCTFHVPASHPHPQWYDIPNITADKH